MILIDCPSCEASMATSMPIPDAVRCEDCAVVWDVTDPDLDEVHKATSLAA